MDALTQYYDMSDTIRVLGSDVVLVMRERTPVSLSGLAVCLTTTGYRCALSLHEYPRTGSPLPFDGSGYPVCMQWDTVCIGVD